MNFIVLFIQDPDVMFFIWALLGGLIGSTYWHLHEASKSWSNACVYVFPTIFYSLILPIGISVLLHDLKEIKEMAKK